MSLLNSIAISNESITRPEVVIRTRNDFPHLPAPQARHFYTSPDATVNYDSANLFRHLQDAESTSKFEYAGPNRLGTQSAYLNVPHTVQKSLVPLVLPSAKDERYGNASFPLSFPHLQRGDIAFYVRLQCSSWELVRRDGGLMRAGGSCDDPPLSLVCKDWFECVRKRRRQCVPEGEIGRSLMMGEGGGVFINLRTVNYILHGIQHYKDTEPAWRDSFWRGFGLHLLDARVQNDMDALCTHVVRQCMTPFGVVVSEVSHCSDQCAAMVVDGRVERMRNYWAAEDPEDNNSVVMPQAGDELVLVLEHMEVKLDEKSWEEEVDRWAYVLPGSSTVGFERAVFPIKRVRRACGTDNPFIGPEEKCQWIWQLVPKVLAANEESCSSGRGFWRIGTVY
jgi:hypothetical protein